MASASLFALLDDISAVLDDISLMTKVAAKKTAGVLGDDLALNAEQVSGVRADRELPVVWAVAKGSLRNKLILVPAALLISALAPWVVMPLLMAGGAFLCYEGCEKLVHSLAHDKAEALSQEAPVHPPRDIAAHEKEKVQGAIRTDFILSAEIIVIALGTVAAAAWPQRLAVLSGVALLMTVGVYGLVAGIVKLDDGGLFLVHTAGSGTLGKLRHAIGMTILRAAPYLMKSLSVVGTIAMFLVGGGIIAHGVPWIHHAIEELTMRTGMLSGFAHLANALMPSLLNASTGVIVGAATLAVVTLGSRLVARKKA